MSINFISRDRKSLTLFLSYVNKSEPKTGSKLIDRMLLFPAISCVKSSHPLPNFRISHSFTVLSNAVANLFVSFKFQVTILVFELGIC